MRHKFSVMLDLQNKMNSKVHSDWIGQNFEWYRALWIECGELMEHYGYKWWKKQTPDMAQVQLEIVDIWHFGLSMLMAKEPSFEALSEQMSTELQHHVSKSSGVLEATEQLVTHTLSSRQFSVGDFQDLLFAADMSWDQLYRSYIGKNVLNFFRQDHGYKDGSYQKIWDGREDNEHLVEIAAQLSDDDEMFADHLYRGLKQRYQKVIGV